MSSVEGQSGNRRINDEAWTVLPSFRSLPLIKCSRCLWTISKPQPGHDAVAIADAHAGLGQVQLEAADILGRRRVGGAMPKRGKPLAAANVTSLRARRELPRIHVLDHAMTQRGDGIRTHGKLLSWMRLTTPRSSRQGPPPAIDELYPGCRVRRLVSLSELSRSDLVL